MMHIVHHSVKEGWFIHNQVISVFCVAVGKAT